MRRRRRGTGWWDEGKIYRSVACIMKSEFNFMYTGLKLGSLISCSLKFTYPLARASRQQRGGYNSCVPLPQLYLSPPNLDPNVAPVSTQIL